MSDPSSISNQPGAVVKYQTPRGQRGRGVIRRWPQTKWLDSAQPALGPAHEWVSQFQRDIRVGRWQLYLWCTSCEKDHVESHAHDDLVFKPGWLQELGYAPLQELEEAVFSLNNRTMQLLHTLKDELCYPLEYQSALSALLYHRLESAGAYGVSWLDLMELGMRQGHPYHAVEWVLRSMELVPAGIIPLDHRCVLPPEGADQALL